mmetsp:Transcript_13688/g.30182  ORF Transcript_13688/g.30182 Transcript_13688/m.30182 type:complete len:300 (-) Transcript_13688:377-1276(-)
MHAHAVVQLRLHGVEVGLVYVWALVPPLAVLVVVDVRELVDQHAPHAPVTPRAKVIRRAEYLHAALLLLCQTVSAQPVRAPKGVVAAGRSHYGSLLGPVGERGVEPDGRVEAQLGAGPGRQQFLQHLQVLLKHALEPGHLKHSLLIVHLEPTHGAHRVDLVSGVDHLPALHVRVLCLHCVPAPSLVKGEQPLAWLANRQSVQDSGFERSVGADEGVFWDILQGGGQRVDLADAHEVVMTRGVLHVAVADAAVLDRAIIHRTVVPQEPPIVHPADQYRLVQFVYDFQLAPQSLGLAALLL